MPFSIAQEIFLKNRRLAQMEVETSGNYTVLFDYDIPMSSLVNSKKRLAKKLKDSFLAELEQNATFPDGSVVELLSDGKRYDRVMLRKGSKAMYCAHFKELISSTSGRSLLKFEMRMYL